MESLSEDLELYERRRLLCIEKELAKHHQDLARVMHDLEQGGPSKAAERLSDALWQLGAVIAVLLDANDLRGA